MTGHKLGKTRVFLKFSHLEQLSDAMTRLHKAAILLQKGEMLVPREEDLVCDQILCAVARGFVKRSKFVAILESKREQDVVVADFLHHVQTVGEHLLAKQLSLSYAVYRDDPPPSAPPLDLLPPPSSPPPGPTPVLRFPSSSQEPLPPPPPDLSAPPPEPLLNDLVSRAVTTNYTSSSTLCVLNMCHLILQ